MEDLLIRWSIDRKHTEAHRDSVISHMKITHGEMGVDFLPPIYKIPIDDLTDDEIRLLDNFNHLFFKAEVVGVKLF